MKPSQGKAGHKNLRHHLVTAILTGELPAVCGKTGCPTHPSKHLSPAILKIMMILGSWPPWVHGTLSLRKTWMMAGRRDIVSQGAGSILEASTF